MTETRTFQKPAWQTDELQDEWIDEEDDDEVTNSLHAHSASDLSLTQPIGSVLVRNADIETLLAPSGSEAGGTFVVRDDVPAAPLMPKTPGRGKKAFGKDFFSPLALEKMFEPPSPPLNDALPLQAAQVNAPVVPSRLSQVYVPGQDDTELIDRGLEDRLEGGERNFEVGEVNMAASEKGGAVLDCQFTFQVPRPSPFNPMGPAPEAQSTPGPPHADSGILNPPHTDPRLRLFQFQYDTFTREHLSAMVDSIAVNTPSGGSGTGRLGEEPSPVGLSPVHEASISRLRSAKRIKLSPASDYSEDGDRVAVIMRPQNSRRDYVGESKSLMEKIRQARDFSTVSTVATARSPAHEKDSSPSSQGLPDGATICRPSFLGTADAGTSRVPSSSWTAASSKRGIYSSIGYREQAANLMAQIRNDMKGSKRFFSGDTEVPHMAPGEKAEKSIVNSNTADHTESYSTDGHHGKENTPEHTHLRKHSASDLSTSTRAKQKASPRKLLRRLSAADEVDRELAEEIAHMSMDSQLLLEQFPEPPVGLIVTAAPSAPSSSSNKPGHEPNPALLAPSAGNAPTYPSSSVRSGRNEDLTRFVSSSTASGTTLTTGSTASFVKHQGPKQITRITPEDIPSLPERVGKMVFDKVLMKWVKAPTSMPMNVNEEDERDISALDGENDSEDPFRDIESLQEDDTRTQDVIPDMVIHRRHDEQDESPVGLESGRIEQVDTESESEDEEEAELTSFSFDEPSTELAQAMTGEEVVEHLDDTESEDEHDDDGTDTIGPSGAMGEAFDDSDDGYQDQSQIDDGSEPALQDSPPHLLAPHAATSLSTPHPPSRATSGPTPIRSAMKSSSITPVSVMKDSSGTRNHTPANKLGHRRSVSFSDGRRDGPILGIGRNAPTPDATGEVDDDSPLGAGSSKGTAMLVPSTRSKRITDMLENLEDPVFDDESPSKANSSGRPPSEELQPMKPRRPSSAVANVGSSGGEISRRVFSRSHAAKSPRTTSRNPNATFLTECSFGVAHDRLVQVITDVQPFEPHWEELTCIDLSKRNIESVARLKEFLPRLDSLCLNCNQLSWLSGVPGTVRSLSVASNTLTGITSFGHLLNLESLDISRNQIDSLRQLECLRHLRELRADGNRIDSTDGLHQMDGLVKLSLEGNYIHSLDLNSYSWTRLEMLNLSQNRLVNVEGLASLPALIALNLDNNVLERLEAEGTMPRLRILRVSGNRLQQLNASTFPNLRTLYADNNSLGTITKAYRLTKLENLSLRNQSGRTGL
ncbi:hypothetical protein AcV7_004839 [Taiwanofungus camphoratus]|nr:hypothetical protein AcV7_004839 [Antrodia cinnamomea]